jgi:hypothetical protein
MTLILVTLAASYNIAEGRTPLGWYQHYQYNQNSGKVIRFVPIYDEADRSKAKQFWKLNWDAPDVLGLMEMEVD